jgi:hypothetical protein
MPVDQVSGSIQNHQCRIDSVAVNSSSDNLTLTLNVAFQAGFTGNRFVYAATQDDAGHGSGWQSVATLTVQ